MDKLSALEEMEALALIQKTRLHAYMECVPKLSMSDINFMVTSYQDTLEALHRMQKEMKPLKNVSKQIEEAIREYDKAMKGGIVDA